CPRPIMPMPMKPRLMRLFGPWPWRSWACTRGSRINGAAMVVAAVARNRRRWMRADPGMGWLLLVAGGPIGFGAPLPRKSLRRARRVGLPIWLALAVLAVTRPWSPAPPRPGQRRLRRNLGAIA